MDAVFVFLPILFWLISIAIAAVVFYFVIKAAVRNGINTSIIGKRVAEKETKHPKM